MALADTSVWIEFLHGTPGPATDYVRANLGRGLSVTEPVLTELLAGARPGPMTAQLERLLLSQDWYPVDPRLDFRAAVDVFHATRAAGHQPRSVQDCLIAAVALRVDEPVAHRDGDFRRIADATGLRVVDLRS